MRALCALAALLVFASEAAAQDYDGYFSSLFLVMPDVDEASGAQPVAELRSRLFAEGLFNPTDRIHVRLGAYVDTLAGRRQVRAGGASAADAILRPADIYVEYRGDRFDVRAGMSRIVWGRLDEFQPTDVVNPIDLSRFLLEGRSEARLPVAIARGRIFLPHSSTVEAVAVPVFRAARFDQLDEATSPFLLAPPGVRQRHEPGVSWSNLQGGVRFTTTTGRVDWGVSAWRGFETFPVYQLTGAFPRPAGADVPVFLERSPRFTMVGAEFETVHGPWGVRGEAAWFDSATPRSFEGGVGVDRRAGSYRVAANVLISRAAETDVSVVGWAERSFAGETRTARLLAVYDPDSDTAFLRGIGAVSVRDNVWIEGSAGWFAGEANAPAPASAINALGLLARRDFLYARLKVHF